MALVRHFGFKTQTTSGLRICIQIGTPTQQLPTPARHALRRYIPQPTPLAQPVETAPQTTQYTQETESQMPEQPTLSLAVTLRSAHARGHAVAARATLTTTLGRMSVLALAHAQLEAFKTETVYQQTLAGP
jgi:hypothetical protein